MREVIVHPGLGGGAARVPDGRILMIRQYRHAAGQYLWELVAGHASRTRPSAKARRASCRKRPATPRETFTKLLEIYPSPGTAGRKNGNFSGGGTDQGTSRSRKRTKKSPSEFSPCRNRGLDSRGQNQGREDRLRNSVLCDIRRRQQQQSRAAQAEETLSQPPWKTEKSPRYCARPRNCWKSTAPSSAATAPTKKWPNCCSACPSASKTSPRTTKKLRELPGVGENMAEHIREILKTGDYSLRQKLLKKYPRDASSKCSNCNRSARKKWRCSSRYSEQPRWRTWKSSRARRNCATFPASAKRASRTF